MSRSQDIPTRIGPHRVIAQIGEGPLGPSYLIRVHGAQGSGELSVIKDVTAPELTTGPLTSALIEQLELAARLDHRNIAKTYGASDEEEGLFIATEYVDGQPWSRVRARLWGDGQLRRMVHLRLLCDVLSGLQHAHEQGQLHCGVSPNHVYLGYEGRVQLAGFGSARLLATPQLVASELFGRERAYAAPELLRGASRDARADLYSVGVMLWEALARAPLHPRSGDRIASIRDVVSDVPPALARICTLALRPDPDDRLPSAAAFRDELLAQLPNASRAPDPTEAARLMAQAFHRERDLIHGAIARDRTRPFYVDAADPERPRRPGKARFTFADRPSKAATPSIDAQGLPQEPPLVAWMRSLLALGLVAGMLALIWVRSDSPEAATPGDRPGRNAGATRADPELADEPSGVEAPEPAEEVLTEMAPLTAEPAPRPSAPALPSAPGERAPQAPALTAPPAATAAATAELKPDPAAPGGAATAAIEPKQDPARDEPPSAASAPSSAPPQPNPIPNAAPAAAQPTSGTAPSSAPTSTVQPRPEPARSAAPADAVPTKPAPAANAAPTTASQPRPEPAASAAPATAVPTEPAPAPSAAPATSAGAKPAPAANTAPATATQPKPAPAANTAPATATQPNSALAVSTSPATATQPKPAPASDAAPAAAAPSKPVAVPGAAPQPKPGAASEPAPTAAAQPPKRRAARPAIYTEDPYP